MSIIIKFAIIAVWALIIIVGEIIVFGVRKRKFTRGEPMVGLIIRRDFTKDNSKNPAGFDIDLAEDTNSG